MSSTRNLSLLGLGVDGDVQPHDRYPALTPGNHLRWAFASHRGFPRNGYYVFRREHRGPRSDPILLTDALPEKIVRRGIEESFSTPDGETFEFSDSSTYTFHDDYDLHPDRTFGTGTDDEWEFQFEGGQSQTIALPETAYRVDFSLAVEGIGSTTVTALAGERAVAEKTVSESGIVTLQAAHFGRVRIEGTQTSLVELACFSLAAETTTGWSLLEDAPEPITLPLAHPDYPAAQGSEDLLAARGTARDRVSYGDPDRFVPDPTPVESGGTATVTNGSAIVTGHDTDWSPDLAGSVFALAGDDTGYVVAQVLEEPDRLVLGRAYEGSSASDAAYELADDPFGQLHDYLTHLVDDGPSAGGMASRVVPEPVHEQGTIRFEDDRTVAGSGTNWSDDFEGLTLRVARDVGGTVTVMHGIPIAISSTADWDERLVGDRFRVADERELYTITDVRSVSYQGTTVSVLSLDRPVSGLHDPSRGLDYDVFEADGVEVTNVAGPTTLETAYPHPGPNDGTHRNYVLTPSLSTPDANAPSMPYQYPMDLALLASLDPAVAQLLGLYWIDETADPDTSYDYMVVADHGLEQSREWRLWPRMPEPIDPEDLPGVTSHPLVDYHVVHDVQPGDAGVLDAPTDAKAYPLPPTRGRSDVGLRWDQDDDPTGTDPAGTYYLWRCDCGDEPPDAPPAPADYDVLTRDDADPDDEFVAAAEPVPRTQAADDPPASLPGWPDERMQTVDTNLADGWYSYRVTSMDLFGRHSPPGEPATWTDPDGGTHTHPAADRAVEVAADLPPPPPTGVEASALDPGDPYVRADDAYENWRAENEGEVGLRVRWLWTEERAASAPDVGEFQVHFQPGRLNAHVGEITAVSAAGDGYRVETDIDSVAADDEFAGATLQVGARGFPIVASGGDPLWVEVEPADPTADTAVTDGGLPGEGIDLADFPADPFEGGTVDVGDVTIGLAPISPGDECTVSVPAAYDRGTVTVRDEVVTVDGEDRTVVRGTDTGWSAALEDQEFRTVDDVEAYEVYRIDSPTKLLLDRVYEPPGDLPARHRTYAIAHPAGTDYTDVDNWARHPKTVQYADNVPREDGEEWPRVYETFVTLADTTGFEPSVIDPKAFASASVTAVDAADRDGPVAAPAKVARVYRETPEPPSIPVIDADFEWASEADYHGKSRYTVRWKKPGPDLKTHVFRALDETLFATDWQRRQDAIDAGRTDEITLSESDHGRFPEPLRPTDADDEDTRESKKKSRETIASELDRLNDTEDLAGDEDAAMAFYRSLRDPEKETDDDVEKLKPAMVRVLAGLPGNESAYTQVTMDPLDPEDYPNKPGPDTGPGESYPQGNLCAYVDSFDGRSRNCYFYRTGTVDPAGNRSDQREAGDGEPMSYPTPGVKAPDVVPPTAPTVTKITAGHQDPDESDHGAVTLQWQASDKANVDLYRVYRASNRENTRDVRLMTEVDSVSNPDSDTIIWTDESPPPLQRSYYRLLAVDENGNVSEPSDRYAARATESPPAPPTPTVAWEADGSGGHRVAVSWTSEYETMVQFKTVGANQWFSRTDWLSPGSRTFHDGAADPTKKYDYRLLARSTTGATGTGNAATITELTN